MDVLQNGANLIDGLIIFIFALFLIFWNGPGPLLKEFLVFHLSEVCFIHLPGHVLEVLKYPHLIVVSFLVKERLIRIFVIL